MSKPRIGIIITSTRQSRFGERPAKWILDIAQARGDADYEIVDLRDYEMPLFDAPASPRFVPVTDDGAKRWASKLAELDGYIFIVAEYNHSITGVLKNALDHVYDEPARKPAAFVAYGGTGGARAVEHLRMMLVELSVTPTKSAVHINMEPFVGLFREGKDFSDYPYLGVSVTPMLDELAWWTSVLRTGREQVAFQKAA